MFFDIRTNHVLNTLQALANGLGQQLVSLTEPLNDVVGSTAVDAFMDAAKGVGHRVVHGHSLDNLPVIFQKFGFSGVGDYSVHGLRDAMSPHGMPIPFAKEIAEFFAMAPKTAVDWLCFNVGDALAGGFSIYDSYRTCLLVRDYVAAGFMPREFLIGQAIRCGVKLGFGLWTTNPISIACGFFDVGVLTWGLVHALHLGKVCIGASTSPSLFSIFLGGLSGAASAMGLGGILYALTEESWDIWMERMKKLGICGAVGGMAGVGASAFSADPSVIAAAAVGGYVAAEWAYDNAARYVSAVKGLWDWSRGPNQPSPC